MTEYCRLCAELKEPMEIAVSIDDAEQSMDEKLRACCQWTDENISNHRLPHSVCSICLNKLDKSWLFAQSVQLAQQQLLEIFEIGAETERKAWVAENILSCSDLGSSVIQLQYKCEICSHEFSTVDSLELHRQQGCEGLVDIDAHIEDCKPTPIDSECHVESQLTPYKLAEDSVEPNATQTHTEPGETPSECSLAKHSLRPHQIPTGTPCLLECDACGRQFKHKKSLRRHCKQNHETESERNALNIQKTKYATCEKERSALVRPVMINTAPDDDGDVKRQSKLKKNKTITKQPNDYLLTDNDGTADDAPIPPKPQYKCAECDLDFPKEWLLKRHCTIHTGKRPFECWLCHKLFRLRDALSVHMQTHVHTADERKKLKTETKKKKSIGSNQHWHKCNVCSRSFSRVRFLRDHMDRDHNGHRFQCDECGRQFRAKGSLNSHRMIHSNERYECWLCHNMLRSMYKLKYHMRWHLNHEMYDRLSICEQCGKSFRTKTTLSNHMQAAHSNQRPYKCDTCGLGFKTEMTLKTHRKSHKSFEFKCSQCDKMFRKNVSLKKHMEYHTGKIAKPFVCDVCDKAFRINANLVEHRRIHTGEKPFACQHCASHFRTMSNFYSHLRKTHGISVSAKNRENMMRITAMSK